MAVRGRPKSPAMYVLFNPQASPPCGCRFLGTVERVVLAVAELAGGHPRLEAPPRLGAAGPSGPQSRAASTWAPQCSLAKAPPKTPISPPLTIQEALSRSCRS